MSAFCVCVAYKRFASKLKQSANGAEYESPGQARRASPRGTYSKFEQGLKGRNRYYALSALDQMSFAVTRGDTLRFASRLPLAFIFRALGAFFRP